CKGEYDRARKDFEKAMEINPKYEYPVGNIGGIYFQQGKFSPALKWLNKALGMKDESNLFNEIYWFKILIYKEQGNKEFLEIALKKAENYIKKQIRKYPKKAFNYLDLAEIYCEAGKKIDEAKKLAKKGFKLKKDYYSHYVLGRVYLAEWKALKAVKEFEKAIKLNPSDIWSYYWLGKTYFYRLGDSETAKYYYEKGLKINPNFRLIKKELRKLK
ncbi:MAG: tetratricopeptide repeat protein, partial [Elusimicrobia bacterium]|nr:tetratricopeptide repeat protein [Elusimicrobiota bacterium]